MPVSAKSGGVRESRCDFLEEVARSFTSTCLKSRCSIFHVSLFDSKKCRQFDCFGSHRKIHDEEASNSVMWKWASARSLG